MNDGCVLDTGPLVAFLNRRDTYHDWAREALNTVRPPLLTCEAVVSEACFLVRDTRGGARAIFDLLRRDLLRLAFRLDEEADRVAALMKKYEDVPMSLADGCVVRMAEMLSRSVVLTLDRDFRVYRKQGRLTIPTMMPKGM